MPDLHTSSRPFHTTPAALKGNLSKEKLRPTKSTLLRREMAEWLNGPGYKFRRPFPGSTNYLSAYDKNGNLAGGGLFNPRAKIPLRVVTH